MSRHLSAPFFVKTGQGRKNLLLFHGFGQDHHVFLTLAQSLADEYTCYVFDLYFHGNSIWHYTDETPLEKTEWSAIVGSFLQQQQLDTFAVLGYSLGAKFALAIAEAIPERVTDIFLVAPDGIRVSPWYSLATAFAPGRNLFKSMIARHERFLTLAQALQKPGLMDKGVLRFAASQMTTEEKRRRVYYSWVVFRKLKFDLKQLAEIINRHNINVHALVGKHDRLMKPATIQRLLKLVRNHRLHIADTGHNGLLGKELMDFVRGNKQRPGTSEA